MQDTINISGVDPNIFNTHTGCAQNSFIWPAPVITLTTGCTPSCSTMYGHTLSCPLVKILTIPPANTLPELIPTGWQCPKCKSIYAPSVIKCTSC